MTYELIVALKIMLKTEKVSEKLELLIHKFFIVFLSGVCQIVVLLIINEL